MKVIVGEARPVIFFPCSCGPLDPGATAGDGYADGNFFPWFRTRLDDRICLVTKKQKKVRIQRDQKEISPIISRNRPVSLPANGVVFCYKAHWFMLKKSMIFPCIGRTEYRGRYQRSRYKYKQKKNHLGFD